MLNRFKGVTLIELVLYLTLFSTIILVIAQFFVFVGNKNLSAKHMLTKSRNIIYLNELFSYYRGKTNIIDYSSSTFDNINGKLQIQTADGLVIIEKVGSNIQQTKSGVVSLLNDPQVIIEEFFLTRIVDGNNVNLGANISVKLRHQNLDNQPSDTIEYVYTIR